MSTTDTLSWTVIAAANNWDGIRMADRQLAERLAAHRRVLYVDPPISVVSRLRSNGWRTALHVGGHVERLGPRLARLTPDALPGWSRPGLAAVNARLVAAQVRRAVHRLGGRVGTTIEAVVLSPIMGRCGETTKVYWAQDDFVGLAPIVGQAASRFAKGERQLIKDADVIVAANPVVASSIAEVGRTAELIPFGCDYELFSSAATATPSTSISLARPYAVFMGHLGDRIDLSIIEAIADTGTRLLLVGPLHPRTDRSTFDAILARSNVQWVGARPFEELPTFLAGGEVGVLPYTHSRFNLGSFPLKTLEYLAAGLPVVATRLPAIEWLGTNQICAIDDAREFAAAVAMLVHLGRDAEGDHERRKFAENHSWEARAQQFNEVIDRSPA